MEYLWETGAEQVYFVVPGTSIFLRNIIGLKLLKREADRLGKMVFLVTRDEIGREMAKRAGLNSRAVLPKLDEEIQEPIPDEETLKEMPPKRFESMLEEEIETKRQAVPRSWQMSDIRPKKNETEKMAVPDERPVFKELESEIPLLTEDYFDTWRKIQREELPDDSDEEPEAPGQELEAEDETFEKEEPRAAWYGAKTRKRNLADGFKRFFSGTPAWSQENETPSVFFIPAKFLTVFIGAAVLIAVAALYFILPKAEINIVPKTEPLVQDLILVADKGLSKIDLAQNKIPAQLIKLDKKETKEFSATGQRQFNEKAGGTITIYNEYSSSPQALVEKTRFVSNDGKTFRLVNSVTIPGAKIQEGKIIASSIEAKVQAEQAGEEYNIGPSDFKIPGFQGTPKYDAFYGRSQTSMAGGVIGAFKVVSQDDLDKAKNELWQNLQSSLEQEARAQTGDLKLIDNALKKEISSVSSSVEVGGRAEKFALTIKAAAIILLFDEKDISELINKKILEKTKGSDVLQGKIEEISYRESQADFSGGRLSFKAKISGKIIWKVNKEQLQKEIAGKSENEVKEILMRHSEIDKAQVIFWPFWVKSVPKNLDKVKIAVE